MPLGGTSYQPMAQQPMPQGGMQRAAVTPQEAVRILSLRLPKNPQASPVPSALLNSAGGGTTSNLTQLLQMLMRAAAPAPYEDSGSGPGTKELVSDAYVPPIDNGIGGYRTAPMPHITVGDQGNQPGPAPTPPDGGDTPLFDQGIPPIRNMPKRGVMKPPMDTIEPLF